MTYTLGQTFPALYIRGIVGDDCPPVWHALKVRSGRERATVESLILRGVRFAFFPSHEVMHFRRGRAIEAERAFVPGVVYAKFHRAPQWDVMKDRHRLITGVFTRHGLPVAIHPDVIRHLQGLTVEAERLRLAREEMMRIRPGDKANIIAGPLSTLGKGFAVEVLDVRNGRALVAGLFGAKVWAEVTSLQRVNANSETAPESLY